MNMSTLPAGIRVAVPEPDLLGESPVWHPGEQALYWCDIPGHRLRRLDPRTGATRQWGFHTDVACCAPAADGTLLLALRDGIWRFHPADGRSERLVPAPYDMREERFNDGKCDPAGRLWVGTLYEPRDAARAGLYCYDGIHLDRRGGDVTVSNGLAWSPDARTMYWSDTKAHVIHAMAFEAETGHIGPRRTFARFPPRAPGAVSVPYEGRPDGAAVDVEGGYWVAMFEGGQVLRLRPDGRVDRRIALPVRCPTMPCFGGADLRTLYITTSRLHVPDDARIAEPWAGCVLALEVDVPGLPAKLFGH